MKRIITGCLLLNFAMAAQAVDLPLYFQTSVIT